MPHDPAAISDAFQPTLEQRRELETALRSVYFAARNPAILETEAGRKDLEDHIAGRYLDFLAWVIPWLETVQPLEDLHVVEIGGGSGSSAAALSQRAGRIDSYEIVDKNVAMARKRCRILGIENAYFHLTDPQFQTQTLLEKHSCGVDLVLIYGVLEHMKITERLDTLSTCWRILKPGGLLVVGDTPNRLVYLHEHTSRLPFFDMLPDQLAVRYAEHSPNKTFRQAVLSMAAEPVDQIADRIDRWGRGVSFHEFELALGDLRDLVALDGYQEILLRRKTLLPVEKHLLRFMIDSEIPVPLGFSRKSLDVVLRKPGGSVEAPATQVDYAGLLRMGSAEEEAARLREQNEELHQQLIRLNEEFRQRVTHLNEKLQRNQQACKDMVEKLRGELVLLRERLLPRNPE